MGRSAGKTQATMEKGVRKGVETVEKGLEKCVEVVEKGIDSVERGYKEAYEQIQSR